MSGVVDYTHEIDGYTRGTGDRQQAHYQSHRSLLDDLTHLIKRMEAFCAYRIGARGERILILRYDDGGFST